MTADPNLLFREEKQGQIAAARDLVERNRAAIASYDAGATQAALDAKLAADVEAGTIKMVSPDRYLVLTGWDAGEEFSVRRAMRPSEVPLILPETGLDFKDGQAQLYLDAPAWHELGNVRLGGLKDIDEVLELSGGAYGVEQRAARYAYKGKWQTVPGKYVNIRDDTGDALGIVGQIYVPIQNRDAFTFLQELVAQDEVTWQSAGPLRGGRKFFVSMRLPENVTIDAGGINAEIVPTLAAINSHDGTTPFYGIATPWNPVCGNTERFAMRDAYTKWPIRHTKTALDRINEARRNLGLTVKYYERYAAEETQLAHIDLQLAEFDKMVADLWPVDDDASDKARGIADRREAALRAGFAKYSDSIGRTALAGEWAVTDWLDHAAPRRAIGGSMAAAKATAALEGSDDALKSKVHGRLLTLAR